MPPSLQERLADAQTECESLKSQLLRLREEIQIHKSENVDLKAADAEWRRAYSASEEKYALLAQRLDAFSELEAEFEVLQKANLSINESVSEYRQKNKALLSENSSLRKRVDALESQSVTDRASKIQLQKLRRQTTESEATVKLLRDEKKRLEHQLRQVSVETFHRYQSPSLPPEAGHVHNTPGLRLTVSCNALTTPGAVTTPGAARDYYTPSTAHSPQFVRAQSTHALSPCFSSNTQPEEGWGSEDFETPQRAPVNLSPNVYHVAARGMAAAAQREQERDTILELERLKSENQELKARLDSAFCWEIPACFSF